MKDNNKNIKIDVEEYIKNFEEQFNIKNIKIDVSKLPLLDYIFNIFGEELYKPSKKSINLRKKAIKLGNKLEKMLNNKQAENFREYWELENQLTIEIEKQLFMYGYIIAQQLNNETNNINK